MPKDLLSDAKIRTAKPDAKPYKLSDGGGLFLLIQPSGSKLWRWKFRLNGKENLFAVGSYPEVGLADARAARDAARDLAKQGINPSQHRKDERQRNIDAAAARKHAEALALEISFAKVSAAYLAEVKASYTLGSYRAKESRIRKYLAPKLDELPITEISAKEIRPILEACKAYGAWAGIHVKGDLSAIFQHAVVRGLVDSNPIPGLRGLLKIPSSQSKAVLTADQIRAFYRALRAYRGYPETALCLRLIAFTACRPGEAADAEWSEFDTEGKLWRRPAAKMKARRDHVSPLSEPVLKLLEELRPITGAGRYLFPHRSGEGFTTPNRLTYAMRDMNLGERTTPHCWRTTFSTWANEQGFRPDAIERQLAHVESNRVRATYNKALLLNERREIMQAWADHLATLAHAGSTSDAAN
ncbi:MAG TPA: integrase arm-type DNA-binding domain-containing protein [Thiobacillaceae bacterium]|nr:integrase arm-type DNA-binding domain-containing protein [Thiobacillaceae bacterium]HNU64770.1 integrase arm-type DNA-binding domain-containing protein [Thiobacillaceae bacterium]